MADSKITALTALTGANLAAGDQFGMVDVSDTTMDASGTNKKMSAAELALGLQAIGVTTATNYLTADVTISTTNTYFDGPSVSLAAGTWFVYGQIILTASTAAARTFLFRLWDGTTDVSNGAHTVEGSLTAAQSSWPLAGIVTPGTTKTYKISATSNTGTTDKIAHNGQKGSFLLAVKIG